LLWGGERIVLTFQGGTAPHKILWAHDPQEDGDAVFDVSSDDPNRGNSVEGDEALEGEERDAEREEGGHPVSNEGCAGRRGGPVEEAAEGDGLVTCDGEHLG
jgi:hypothetical protein